MLEEGAVEEEGTVIAVVHEADVGNNVRALQLRNL